MWPDCADICSILWLLWNILKALNSGLGMGQAASSANSWLHPNNTYIYWLCPKWNCSPFFPSNSPVRLKWVKAELQHFPHPRRAQFQQMGSQRQQNTEAWEKMQTTKVVLIWKHVITKSTVCVHVCECLWICSVCVCVRVCERACMCVSVWMLSVTTQCNMSRLSFLDWDIMLYIFINMNIKLTFKHTLQAQAMCLNYCPVIAGYKSLYRHCLVLLFLCLYVLFCVCSGDYLAVLLFCHTLFWQGRGGLFFIAHAKC